MVRTNFGDCHLSGFTENVLTLGAVQYYGIIGSNDSSGVYRNIDIVLVKFLLIRGVHFIQTLKPAFNCCKQNNCMPGQQSWAILKNEY